MSLNPDTPEGMAVLKEVGLSKKQFRAMQRLVGEAVDRAISSAMQAALDATGAFHVLDVSDGSVADQPRKWTILRSWDTSSQAYFLSYRRGKRTRDDRESPHVRQFLADLRNEIRPVVMQRLVSTMRAMARLRFGSLEGLLGAAAAAEVMES